MISRILVPMDARLPAAAAAATQRRRPTTMDERTLVPAMLPIVPLNGQSTIPANLPLESIAARVVVPRDINREAYGVKEDVSTPLQPTEMDERIAVPIGVAPPPVMEPMTVPPSADLVGPDVFMTGEVHFVAPEQKECSRAKRSRGQVATHHAILLRGVSYPPGCRDSAPIKIVSSS